LRRNRMTVFEKKVRNGIFGSKIEEGRGEWRKIT
jgi:hypothetical protein